MRLLFVEDKPEFAQTVERALRRIHGCDVTWVASRDSALRALADKSFDLVILDRRIPTEDRFLDDHAEHGWSVFQSIRERTPGTSVWFLTATEDADFATEINNEHGRAEDIHGKNTREQMYRVFWKRRMDECLRKVSEFATECAALDRIAIRDFDDLDLDELRILRQFARLYNGAAISVAKLGGLSGSRVVKAVVLAADGTIEITAVAKLATIGKTGDEATRYRADVLRLAPGGAPSLTKQIEVGAGNIGGLFYGMIGDSVESIFQLLASNDRVALSVPPSLRQIQREWYGAKRLVRVSVAQIRRKFVGDAQLHELAAELEGINIVEVEAHQINAMSCCQHGDLHCANVVFDRRRQPMLIDFGDVGPSFSAADPLTLELSTVFHPDSAILPAGWPTEAAIDRWVSVADYTVGCPYAEFVAGCREWALAEAAGMDEVVATAYGYALRQLKYRNAKMPLAKTLVRACIRYFSAR